LFSSESNELSGWPDVKILASLRLIWWSGYRSLIISELLGRDEELLLFLGPPVALPVWSGPRDSRVIGDNNLAWLVSCVLTDVSFDECKFLDSADLLCVLLLLDVVGGRAPLIQADCGIARRLLSKHHGSISMVTSLPRSSTGRFRCRHYFIIYQALSNLKERFNLTGKW
jgi:hypothetical protein